MIQTFCFTAQLGEADADPLIAMLNGKMELRHVDLRAADGILHMDLRCEGRDRWTISRHAKLIVSAMVRRIKLDPATVKLESIISYKDGKHLTAAQGRPIENLHRGPRPKPAVVPWWDEVSQP